MRPKHHAGFTLYELLITLLVAAVLLGLGVPSLQDAQRNSAISGAANDIITGFLAARAEAVKRRTFVTLCASPDPTAGNPVCSQTGAGANGGFIVWIDENGNVDPNGTPILTDATDGNAVVNPNETTLIRQSPAPSMVPNGPLQIWSSNSAFNVSSAYIVFGPNGFPINAPPAGAPQMVNRILLCDNRGNKNGPGGANFSTARLIKVDQTGRAAVVSDKNEIAANLGQIPGAVCPLG